MFFQGDLQSGISQAIQEQKLVACFVRQAGNEQSAVWENEWLQEPAAEDTETTLGASLAQKAVLLRIEAGSQEAGFLSAFCSLSQIPKLVIISNGTVLDDLEGDISKDDFIARITSRVCNTQDVPSVSSEPPAASTTQTTPHSSTIPASPRQSVQPSEAPTQQDNARVQSLMAERSARLQKERKKQEEADKEARRAVAKARREKAKEEETTNASGTAPKARSDWLQEQRTRQQDAKMERERILKSIESDKAARREREVQRRLAAQADAAGGAESADPVQQAPRTSQRGPTGAAPTHCALQIRLFDGTSIRSRFTSDSTLSAAVRAYVAEQSDTTIPYNFRQMQTPLPSRTIDITEENESLLSLGLAPSATLVLVPVKGYTDAYMVSGGTGVINKGINMTYHLATGTYGVVTGLLGRLTGYGGDGASDGPYVAGTGDEQEPSNVAGRRMAQEANQPGPSGIKIRTLADQRRENEKTEFYNGNQLSTEPRGKADDDDTK